MIISARRSFSLSVLVVLGACAGVEAVVCEVAACAYEVELEVCGVGVRAGEF